jgi:VWFA-related protein
MFPTGARLPAVVAGLVLYLGAAPSEHTIRASAQATAPQTPSTFRTGIDLIPVDVQVSDASGEPIRDLSPDAFEVTINGRKRRVVSADLIDFGRPPSIASTRSSPESATSTSLPAARGAAPADGARRIVVLAIDCSSFDEATGRPILAEAADYIRRLSPNDEVGLFAFPLGPKIDPTTDHEVVIRALGTIVARREAVPPGHFALAPGDIVELSRSNPPTAEGERLLGQLCGDPPEDPLCVFLVNIQVQSTVTTYEGIAQANISMLGELMAALGSVPERKTVVLVSGGLLSADIPGARPDNHTLGLEAGKMAARSNVALYTLFVDQVWTSQMSAETRRRPATVNPGLDSALFGKWLSELSGAAGGSFFRLTTGNSATAFDRILVETSAYYLLGVEPAPEDRDGRPRELRVKVNRGQAHVRGRSWVVVPKPGEGPVRSMADAKAPPAPAAAAAILPPPPAALRSLADLFDRDDPAALRSALGSSSLAIIQAFRESQSPWPASPRRTAAFALELGLAGLRSRAPQVPEASLRLLSEYAIRVRQPDEGDPFECTWLWAAGAGILGLYQPEAGIWLNDRAVDRCPGHASLLLTRAVFHDQQLMLSTSALGPRAGVNRTREELERRVLEYYEAAAASPESRHEALTRAAFLHLRADRAAEGLARMDQISDPPVDPQVRYLGQLVRGHLLRSVDRTADAIAAYRAALDAWPGAQAARVGLMTLLLVEGDTEAAADLAERVMTEPEATVDPWWWHHLGDYRLFPNIRQRLRELSP